MKIIKAQLITEIKDNHNKSNLIIINHFLVYYKWNNMISDTI